MEAMTTKRFAVRFTGPNKAMAVLGLRASNSYVEVRERTVEVRAGVMFRASIPREQIVSATDDHDRVLGWGVHGGFGTWLVNGSSEGLVRIDVVPSVRVRSLGLPVTLRVLRIAVDDPTGLREALALPVSA